MGTLRLNFRRCQPGNVACPKCFGETELVLTKRDEDGWPLTPLIRKQCDHCKGIGEVPPERASKPIAYKPWPLPPTIQPQIEARKWGQHTQSH